MHLRRPTALGAAALAGAAALSLTLAVPSSASAPAPSGYPDPAPRGPAHPSEPEVAGPDNIDRLDASVRRESGTARGVSVTFDRHSRTASGEKPAAPRRFVFLFDKSLRLHPERFPVCTRDTIEKRGFDACDPESVVGSGRARTYGQDGAVEVKVFNTRYPNGNRGVLITVPETGAIFENTLERVSAPYRSTYRWALDERIEIPGTPAGERGASSRFTVSFGATRQAADGRTHSYAETRAPRGEPLTLGLWSRFVTGQIVLPTARG
ncbi:hypothetical protein [Streptomyces boncukensis]|uniref:Uncharacterized protein n=1 Tax=Streptomyces boncukensis TaxID=2711219 RepID=A0A6G4X3T5_9ACTN|nr:hypothetical protein [Streptomyces boncukensis]NGO71331.1 hypothetical protein [Streptomyces boncukensis]